MSENLNFLWDILADEGRLVSTIDLTELSDLARSEVAAFRAAWDTLAPHRQLALISTMVEQAEANIHLNFHAVLRTCLDDPNAQVRRLAIEGLWEDEKINLVQPLIGLLNTDPDADVAAAAATSLGRYLLLGELGEIADAPVQQAQAALLAAWARFDAPVEVRRRALESLAYTNSPDVHEMIYSAYYDEDELLRQSALFAMGRSVDPRWGRFVLAELNSHQPAMRFESAIAAGEIGLRQAVPSLINRLDDPDASVREAAATALGKIGGPAARRALQALLRGPDEALAQAAEDALDELSFGNQRLDVGPVDDEQQGNASGFDPEPGGRTRAADDEDEFGDLDDEWADLHEATLLGDDDDFDMNDDDFDMNDMNDDGDGDDWEDDEDWDDHGPDDEDWEDDDDDLAWL